jgi:hypothetical protein
MEGWTAEAKLQEAQVIVVNEKFTGERFGLPRLVTLFFGTTHRLKGNGVAVYWQNSRGC